MKTTEKNYTLVGDLASVLASFDAPPSVCQVVARRVAPAVPHGISIPMVKQVILDSSDTGLPNWAGVQTELVNAASRVNQGLSPFPCKRGASTGYLDSGD